MYSSNIFLLEMKEIQWNNLVPGRQYRIQHISSKLLTKLGTFIQNYPNIYKRSQSSQMLGTFLQNYPNLYGSLGIGSEFNKLILSHGPKIDSEIKGTYMSKEWKYFESASSLIAEQVARGLSDRIPEDTAGIIERFLVSKSTLTADRYPLRDAN